MLKSFLLKRSIQERLSFFTCILILFIIVVFGYTSYIAVQNASVTAARKRLSALTGQISAMFAQGETVMVQPVQEIAANKAVLAFLRSNGTDSTDVVQQLLNNARKDTTERLVELYNDNGRRMLSSDNTSSSHIIDAKAFLLEHRKEQIGKIYPVNTQMYFPIIAAVPDGKKIAGYLVKWRQLVSSRQELDGFSKLIGDQGKLYIGTDDNAFWTDGLKPVPAPPADIKNLQKFITYYGPEGFPVIASAQPVPGTRWIILVTLSKAMVTKTARDFLIIIVLIGAILLAIGILSAWLMSKYITTPLKQLTNAANDMASGKYGVPIEVNRKDELGVLANSFNRMATEVHQTHQALERKVKERTSELQATNEELKSFSYSVSHDLRAPLRAVNSYAQILEEDYCEIFDDEGKRLLKKVQGNAKKMGTLIDDLLAFSGLGYKEVKRSFIKMTELTKNVVFDLQKTGFDGAEIILNELHPVYADYSLMTQVMTNLLSNAIKYSSKKENPLIKISSEKKGNEIIYSISDNGAGFDMQYAHKLFGVFQRLHSMQEFEGTGVGLAIVQRIVMKHGGRVWAKGESGKGAIFYFCLPATEEDKFK